MVKIFENKKKETFANGRIVVTDFQKLKKRNFPKYEDGEMFFLDRDGKIYIDSNDEANEPIILLLKTLIQYPQAALQEWKDQQQKKHPDIGIVQDLIKFKGNNVEFMKGLAMFLIPFELESRELRRTYCETQ